MTDATETQFELWIASTRDRFDYHEGPFPDRQAAVAAADEHAMTVLEWSREPKGQAVTADTHGWMYRVYPVREGREITGGREETAVADDATETLTIDAFIAARLDERESAANAAAPGWAVDVLDSSEMNGAIGGYAADLLLLHDPATVLREVARNRRVLERHRKYDPSYALMIIGGGSNICEGCGARNGRPAWPCVELRDLAEVWSTHPDYRSEWTA